MGMGGAEKKKIGKKSNERDGGFSSIADFLKAEDLHESKSSFNQWQTAWP
jgi:hypothetical protein